MSGLVSKSDLNKAVLIINQEISSQLVKKILQADCGKDFEEKLCYGEKVGKRELCELLIEERGVELFSNSPQDEIYEMKNKLLHSIPKELVIELYNRHPSKDKRIETVGYMYKELAQKKWIPGKGYAKDFVETVGFPEIFSGISESRKDKKEVVEEIQPRLASPRLRDYQLEMKNKMLRILNGESNNRNCMVSLPTGGGKTRVAVEAFLEWMQRKFDENKYLVWIAQSEELCEQCISCIEQIWGDKEFILPLRIYRYFGQYEPKKEDLCGGVVVCNIQKLHSQLKTENRDKVELILKHTGALIIDEAHRASTTMYDMLIKEAEQQTEGKLFPICGLSATPGRTKIEEEVPKLINRFEANLIVPEFGEEDSQYREHPIQYFKDKKYLSKTKHVMYRGKKKYKLTEEELLKMQDIEAEYPAIFLKRLAEDKENNQRILSKLCEIPEGKSTLVYTCTVAQAKFFSIYMNHRGFKTDYIDSDTNKNIRRITIEKFKSGEIQFLFNYGVLTTGFDAPKVENIVLARPVRSEILYEQIIGRGIRGAEFGGTEFCTIIDFFDNSLIQGVPQSFERFKKYWDLDENNRQLHPTIDEVEKKKEVYVVEKLKVCPICKKNLQNNNLHYKKNSKDKKMIVRKCETCEKNYVSMKSYQTDDFPRLYFKCNIM